MNLHNYRCVTKKKWLWNASKKKAEMSETDRTHSVYSLSRENTVLDVYLLAKYVSFRAAKKTITSAGQTGPVLGGTLCTAATSFQPFLEFTKRFCKRRVHRSLYLRPLGKPFGKPVGKPHSHCASWRDPFWSIWPGVYMNGVTQVE